MEWRIHVALQKKKRPCSSTLHKRTTTVKQHYFFFTGNNNTTSCWNKLFTGWRTGASGKVNKREKAANGWNAAALWRRKGPGAGGGR